MRLVGLVVILIGLLATFWLPNAHGSVATYRYTLNTKTTTYPILWAKNVAADLKSAKLDN